MTLPINIKVRVLPRFPANVVGRTGISVTKTNGVYYFDLNYPGFPIVPTIPAGTTPYTLMWDSVSGTYILVPVSSFTYVEAPNDGFTYGRQSLTWAKALNLAGGTLTGNLILNADPSTALGAATKQYVDSHTSGIPSDAPSDGTYYGRFNAAWSRVVPLVGSTMTGPLILSGDPTVALGAATKQYVVATSQSYLAGLTLSTAGSSSTFSVAAGIATNSTNADMLTLAAPISKTTGAWAVGTGNGAWDGTGTNPAGASIWQHVFLIKRTDTNVIDVLISASPSAPTLPSPYSEFRRIGSMRTNASNQWISFTQLGDEFLWSTPVQDAANTLVGGSAALYTLSVPTGVQVWTLATLHFISTGTSWFAITSPDQADYTPSVSVFDCAATTAVFMDYTAPVRTNTSAQIRMRAGVNTGNVYINTRGWTDRRGRDA
jgi:hypothetical protein